MSATQHRKIATAEGEKFAVVSGHSLATDVARRILELGGNPVDAAIAGAAVLTVVLPHACTLGGDCFALVHGDGKTYGINGSGLSPFGLPSGTAGEALARGALSCSAPGVLGAWWALHNRFGSLDWAALLKAGIDLARDGIPACRDFARASRANLASLRLDPGCRTLFLRDGEPLKEGDSLLQPALSRTLERIAAKGAAEFYQGQVGHQLCAAVTDRGGVLSVDDLRNYEALWVEPLSYPYRGRVVRAMPPNSYGLVMLLQLAALEGAELADHPLDSMERFALLMKAARAAFQEGAPFVVDPRLATTRLGELFSPERIARLQSAVRRPEAAPKSAIRGQGTALISVADNRGNAITLAQSIFAPFGSIVADPSTGILLNNRLLGFSNAPGHPNAPEPGKRPAHTLSPTMAFENGRLAFLLGTPGGSSQTITLTQVLTSMIDFGVDLPEAIALPRWSMDLKGDFALEPEVGPDMPRQLEMCSIDAHLATDDQRFFFGSAECIECTSDGRLLAAADDRREASTAAI